MPHMLGHLSAKERQLSAIAITHYLTSKTSNEFGKQIEGQATDTQSVDRGHNLFHSVGCVACHSPRDRSSLEKPLSDSIPMGDLTQKYDRNGLVEYLKDPHLVRPSGRMPQMQLTHFEAGDIADFLLQNSVQKLDAWEFDPKLAKAGKHLFVDLNCYRCHNGIRQDVSKENPLGKLNRLDLDRGCLGEQNGSWPDLTLVKPKGRRYKRRLKANPLHFPMKRRSGSHFIPSIVSPVMNEKIWAALRLNGVRTFKQPI